MNGVSRRGFLLITKMLFSLIVLFSISIRPNLLTRLPGVAASTPAALSDLAETKSLKNTIGVVALNEKANNKARKLQFFNEDGSVWYEFSFYDDDVNGSSAQSKSEFQPFAFHRDYFVLALKCVGKDANRFQVVVNESTGLTKFIRRRDNTFKFQTWQAHILDLFAVGFDRSNNPLRAGPGERAGPLTLPPSDATFQPVQIKGNWLKVRWNVSGDHKGKVRYGWVKWKQDGELLIERFYFS